jgi:TRAP-type C4-dicarboxylate transport system permease small subunit
MASSRTIGNLFAAFDTWFTRLCKWLAVISAVCCGLMMTIAVIDIVAHEAFRYAIPMGVEFIEELNVLLVFLVIAYVALERGHIRITVLQPFLPTGVVRGLRIFGYLLGIVTFGIAAWQSWEYTLYGISVPLEKVGVLDFVRWPFIGAVFLGWSLLVISFIVLIGRTIRDWAKGEPVSFL